MNTTESALTEARLLYRNGDWQNALAICRQITVQDPFQVEALGLLGTISQEHGMLPDAIAAFYKVLEINQNDADASHRLVELLQMSGRAEEARIVRTWITHRQGLALEQQGRLDQAALCFREVLAAIPHCVEAHYNLGRLLQLQGKRHEAMQSFQQALRLKPNCAEACLGLGNVFAEQSSFEEAIVCFHNALRFQPDAAQAHAALGAALRDQGKADEAAASLQRALELQPDDRLRILLATRLPVIYQSLADLESWRTHLIEEVRKLHERPVAVDLTNEPATSLFYLPYQGFNDRDIMREVAGLYLQKDEASWRRKSPGSEGGEMKDEANLSSLLPPSSSLPLKVGILSSFLKVHTIGQWMRGLVAKLSRDHFSVTVLSVGYHDDEVAAFIKQHADCYINVPRHLPSARRLIADQHLDMLLYPDIGMDPVTTTLAFTRLAPVQCVTLGHPVTTGLSTIDYFISTADLETAEAEQHYTENLVRLKNLPIYFHRPELPSPLQDREHFGFGKGDHIYVCLQSPFKIHPRFDELLGTILRGDPEGTLVLSRGLVPAWEQLLRQRFAVTLGDVVDRIRFLPMLPYGDYLNLLAVADVQLDPICFGGGSTSYEALAVGLPIVTLPSQLMRGRITFALYKQMQVLDCVAATNEEYVGKALRLGTDPEYRQRIRSKILASNAVLFENSAGIRELEQFLKDVVSSQGSR